MADTYPYMVANGKKMQILDKIRKAAEPAKFTLFAQNEVDENETIERTVLNYIENFF